MKILIISQNFWSFLGHFKKFVKQKKKTKNNQLELYGLCRMSNTFEENVNPVHYQNLLSNIYINLIATSVPSERLFPEL